MTKINENPNKQAVSRSAQKSPPENFWFFCFFSFHFFGVFVVFRNFSVFFGVFGRFPLFPLTLSQLNWVGINEVIYKVFGAVWDLCVKVLGQDIGCCTGAVLSHRELSHKIDLNSDNLLFLVCPQWSLIRNFMKNSPVHFKGIWRILIKKRFL